MFFLHNMSHLFLEPTFGGCANLWTRPLLEAPVGDEGVRLGAHDSNDSACSSKATFPCLAPSFARDWRSSLRVNEPAEPALVDTCW